LARLFSRGYIFFGRGLFPDPCSNYCSDCCFMWAGSGQGFCFLHCSLLYVPLSLRPFSPVTFCAAPAFRTSLLPDVFPPDAVPPPFRDRSGWSEFELPWLLLEVYCYSPSTFMFFFQGPFPCPFLFRVVLVNHRHWLVLLQQRCISPPCPICGGIFLPRVFGKYAFRPSPLCAAPSLSILAGTDAVSLSFSPLLRRVSS